MKVDKRKSYSRLIALLSAAMSACLTSFSSIAEATLENEILISNEGLFFGGSRVSQTAGNGPQYDYVFGRRITPHGDCIKVYKNFVFLTWYRGGESDRHVMLSRYNLRNGVTKTIEFPHRHTGFQNRPYLGDSHNTIAVGISPNDDTIHLLYDMHAYSSSRPSNGSLRNDYFRYSYSLPGAAAVSDDQFTLRQFVNSDRGNYKHLRLRRGESYESLTYPNFFTNALGDLFVWLREGGHTNGAYKFAKYDGSSWSAFKEFNILNARQRGANQNWGIYGDIKFESGKMRIGFHTRLADNRDKFQLSNGFYYAYSNDPDGQSQWKTYQDRNVNLPIIDPTPLKVSEPGDVVGGNKANSVQIRHGADWIVTGRGDIHMATKIHSGSKVTNVHSFKRHDASRFITSTNLSGGDLYTYDNNVYLIGLEDDRVFIDQAKGGTNDWSRLYFAPLGSKRFRHGNVYVDNGKAYFYLMERSRGSAQPIYLQILDLGIGGNEAQPPSVTIMSPQNNSRLTAPANLEVLVEASSNTAGEDIVDVELYLNDSFVRTERREPYLWRIEHDSELENMGPGAYVLRAVATDTRGLESESSATVRVESPNTNRAPELRFTAPTNLHVRAPANIEVNVNASDPDRGDSVVKVDLYINGDFVRTERKVPYHWPRPQDTALMDLSPGRYELTAVATDSQGNESRKSLSFRVRRPR